MFKIFDHIQDTITSYKKQKSETSRPLKHSSYLTEKQIQMRNDAFKMLQSNNIGMKEIVHRRTLKFTHGKFHRNFRGSKFRGVTINGN